MASEQARELRQRGIAAAKAGQKDEARQLLQQSIRLDPTSEAAWLWLASVVNTPAERRFCLEKLLEINPQNETALKALSGMPTDQPSIKRIGETKRSTTGTGEMAAAKQPAADTPLTVPIPPPEKIAELQRQIDGIVLEASAPLPTPVRYVHKTRRRAGESDIVVYRLYLTAGVVGVLLVLLFGFIVLVTTNDDAAEVVFGPSPTNTQTPTQTWTPTPGYTPTPSPEPRISLTPSPTVEPQITQFTIFNLPRPTPIYPALLDRAQLAAVAQVFSGDPEAALPTLRAGRELADQSVFDAGLYYYETIALIEQNSLSRALELIEQGDEQRQERAVSDIQAEAIINAGYAQVYNALAEQADNAGNAAAELENYTLMVERAQAAVEGDENLAAPYLLVARYFHKTNRYEDAIEVLNQGLSVPSLRANADFHMEKASIYFDMREYEMARYQAFRTLYVDPAYEAAHLLLIEIAFTQDDYPRAVQYAQDYLQFYPGSRLGFQYLGDAHRLEGGLDLAVFAYSRGLSAPDDSEATFNMYVGRGRVYLLQRQYAAAADDFSAALNIQNSDDVRLLRMEAAYYAGDYDTVVSDAEDMPTGSARALIFFGRALIDGAGNQRSAFERALPVLESAVESAGAADRATAYEYLARARFGTGNLSGALEAITTALDSAESVDRRYLLGQILEAQGNRAAAILNYEWALTLSEIVPVAAQGEIEEALANLR